jgi:hypothetical protein
MHQITSGSPSSGVTSPSAIASRGSTLAFLAKEHPQALVGDIVDHPLGHQEVRQLRQAPGGKRKPVLGGLGLRDFLDLPPFRQRELPRTAAGVPGIERVEPVGVEVMDDVPDPVRAGEGHLSDVRCGHALRR